jgi:hypothetical protein
MQCSYLPAAKNQSVTASVLRDRLLGACSSPDVLQLVECYSKDHRS